MSIPSFISVRTASERLPEKCLLSFGDGNVLEHIIRRSRFYELQPIVCTTLDPSDDIIENISKKENVKCFRGSVANKLKRWLDCCNHFQINHFHTVDADDPFFDGHLIHKSFNLLKKGYDMVCPTESSSFGAASVGYSLTKDIISKALEIIDDEEDTEMMWHYLDKVKDIKKIILPDSKKNIKVRLTLDYEEDYWMLQTVRRILGNLTDRKNIDQLLQKNPDLYKINWFRNDEWKLRQEGEKKIG